jgi:hypothetical protein
MAQTLRQHLDRRLADLRTERDGNGWLSTWKDIATYISPESGRALYSASDANRGDNVWGKIVGPRASLALRTMAGGMYSGLTSPSRPWFRLTLPDKEQAKSAGVKEWLSEVEKTIYAILQASNFYKEAPRVYKALGGPGTAALMHQDDFDDVIRFYPFMAGEYFLGLSNTLRVNTCYREFRLTVEQTVAWFGLDAVSSTVRSAYDGGRLDTLIDVVHAIEPNNTRIVDSPFAKNKKFRSVYWEKGADDGKFLRQSGYDDFPVLAPTWEREGPTPYGVSPSFMALGDVKALQIQEKRKAQAIELMVRPPMSAPGTLKNFGVTLLPGTVNFIDGADIGKAMVPAFQPNLPIQHLTADMQMRAQLIDEIYHADLFRLVSSLETVRTAAEIVARQEEKMVLLGPVLEGLFDDFLIPALEATYDAAVRASIGYWQTGQGRAILPPPPPDLQGTQLKIEFTSILAQAQRAIGVGSIERFFGFVGNVAAANPAALDKVDIDSTIDEYGEGLGVPPKLIRPTEDAAKLRQARADQQQAAQVGEQMMMAAQGAETLSRADMRGDNALTRLLGVTAA